MRRNRTFAAVDLGASSGRVMTASVDAGGLTLREVHRFANRPVRERGSLYWDVLALWVGVLDGLRRAAPGPLDGIGVDSWAIDYGLLDEDGHLLSRPVHYRDDRTAGVAARVAAELDLYPITGIQELPFTTVYQLVAAREAWPERVAAHALLIPDLFGYWLTGSLGTELTNASTTGLLDVRTLTWSAEIAARLRLRADLFPPIRRPGDELGGVLPDVADVAGLDRPVPVYAVGSHDTASAVLGVPAAHDRFAYISCGTWSLVGVEVEAPVLTEDARAANFSNELGVDGSVRFLRNVMGLWLLQECLGAWRRAGLDVELSRLLIEVATLPAGRCVVDPDRPEFLAPGDMPARLRAECVRIGQPEPQTPAQYARCILDSLAAAYRRTIEQAGRLSGTQVEVVHLVGGGAQNAVLCQLTADACGLPVVAGPVEAAAYGNVLVQARSSGAITGDRWDLRALLRETGTRTYLPGGVTRQPG